MRTLATRFEDCPRCRALGTVGVDKYGEYVCGGFDSCGAIWSSRTAYDRECVARGIYEESKLEVQVGKEYISDGTFHEELQELADIVAYNTLKEVRETLSKAIHGREQMIVESLDSEEDWKMIQQIKALKGMEAWITGQMQTQKYGDSK